MKVKFCIETYGNGWYEEDGITLDLPYVPQTGSFVELGWENYKLLADKCRKSKNKYDYLKYARDEGDEYLNREIKDEQFIDCIRVHLVRYNVHRKEAVVVLSDVYDVEIFMNYIWEEHGGDPDITF